MSQLHSLKYLSCPPNCDFREIHLMIAIAHNLAHNRRMIRNLYIASVIVVVGALTGTVSQAETQDSSKESLARALTLHASFDKALDADFARGDKACYDLQGKNVSPAKPTDDVVLAPKEGKFGGALDFKRKNKLRPAFMNDGILNYNDKSWNTTVSVWLRLDPDKDLEPGYCDPMQIVGDDGKKGFIFLEWSKDEKPRYFRYAIRPLFQIWNPTNVGWDQIPFEKRPMVQVKRAPFAHETWTHVVFTVENGNDKSQPQRGRLYLNGERQGQVENWELTFGWKPERVMLVLGAAYVGYMDDLAVFNRALDDGEVTTLYGLNSGVRELR
jgi:hypothetical protein